MKIEILKRLQDNTILKHSMRLLWISLFTKILGYIEKIVLAYYYGTSFHVDSYIVVLTIVLSIFYFFREIIEPGFLHVFTSARNSGNEKEGWALFNYCFKFILFITIIISIVTLLFPDTVVHLFAPGFEGKKFALSSDLIRISIPACIFLAISTLTGITLNSLKSFAFPASGDLVFKGLSILCLFVLYQSYGIAGAAIGILSGALGKLLVHLTKLYSHLNLLTPVNKPYLRQTWDLTWPLLMGVSVSQVATVIDNIFASYLQEGAIAALSYSKKIVDLPIVLFPYLLSVVAFPYFSQLAVEKKQDQLSNLLADILKWIIISFIPLSIFMFAYSTYIVKIIFQRGAFDFNSTILTSQPLAVYATGMTFFAIEAILVIFYYSNADTKTPVFVGIICVALNIFLTWLLIRLIGYTGIALAYVIQKAVKTFILLLLLRNKISIHYKVVWTFLIKMIVPATSFSLTTFFSAYFLNLSSCNTWTMAIALISIFTTGSILYLFIIYKLNIIKLKPQ